MKGGGAEVGEITGWPASALRIEVSQEDASDPWTPMGVWRTVESEVEADYEESSRASSRAGEDSYTYTDGESQSCQ